MNLLYKNVPMLVDGKFIGNIKRKRKFKLIVRQKNPLIIFPSSGVLFFAQEAYFSSKRDMHGAMSTTAHYKAPVGFFHIEQARGYPERWLLMLVYKHHSIGITFFLAWPFLKVSYANTMS